ncbi:MAG: hypothetical protein ACFB10_06300 [Salibacteraceae bacterium]
MQKSLLHHHLLELVAQKITTAHQAIASTRESRDSDTKSSMGDKYETSREMAQQELNRLEGQLAQAKALQVDLQRIDPAKATQKGELGALIETNKGLFYLAIGWGKITLDGVTVFVLSPAAPLGKHLIGCRTGDAIAFNGQQWQVTSIR